MNVNNIQDLTPNEWCQVVKSLAREEIRYAYAGRDKSPPKIIDDLPVHCVSLTWPIDLRDGVIISAATYLSRLRIHGIPRRNMRSGIEQAIKQLAQCTDHGWEEALEIAFFLATSIPGMNTKAALDDILKRDDLSYDFREIVQATRRQTRR